MNSALEDFLSRHRVLCEERVDWSNGLSFRVTSYLSPEWPPLDTLISVRALVFQGERIMVVRHSEGIHLLPGGRREPNETLEETLYREIVEETGWAICTPSPLGFIRFHHLTPKPPDYRYPHPDFTQAVCIAEAETYLVQAERTGDVALEAEFRSINEVRALRLSSRERCFLEAAWQVRSGFSASEGNG